MQLNETPWHRRQAGHELHLRYHRLVEVHRLTTAWVAELGTCPPDLTRQLERLGRPEERPLEARLDDTMPGDVIGRLEGTIWSLQSLVLRHYLTLPETEARLHLVAQACGQKVARNDWSGFAQTGEPSLRRLVLTLAGTPFANPYLVVRATRSEACIELLQCAHRSAYPEVRDLADSLCVLHGQWLRGFAHGIHPRIEIQSTREHERCRQNWWLGAGRLS